MSKTRRHFTAEQKAEIVRRHVAGKEAVSDLAPAG
jgi:transposase-like protein